MATTGMATTAVPHSVTDQDHDQPEARAAAFNFAEAMRLHPSDGDRKPTTEQLQALLRLVEHLRAEAVRACEAVVATGSDAAWWREHAAWLAMLTPEDCGSSEAVRGNAGGGPREALNPTGPARRSVRAVRDREPTPAGGKWSTEDCLTWIAKNRALLRVLTTQDCGNEVLVSVRPPTHPEDVLMVQCPCPDDAPLAAVAAALEELACRLSADENRQHLRLVVHTRGVDDP